MLTIIVNLSGLVLIGLIIWWFLIKKHQATDISGDRIEIKVHDGIYEPAVIKAKAGQTLHLDFLRQDKSPCSAIVVFKDLDISAELPIDKIHEIKIKVDTPGEYEFTCQMGMYRGKLIVEA